MGTIPMAITGHIRTIIGLHTIGMAGIGITATTAIITTIGINDGVGFQSGRDRLSDRCTANRCRDDISNRVTGFSPQL
jgi:hypothetical protein